MTAHRLISACALVAVACSRNVVQAPKKHLGQVSKAAVPPVVIADDATNYAYRDRTDDGMHVVHNGIQGPPFSEIHVPVFAPHSGRLFYWASDSTGAFIVADGQAVGGDFATDGLLVFSPDGAHWATTAGARVRDGDRSIVVVADGQELGRYPDASDPAVSNDGRRVAYLVEAERGVVRLLLGGHDFAAFPPPDDPCATRTERRPMAPNLWPQFQVRYLSDGRLLTMTQDREGWGIYRHGIRLATYPASVVPHHPAEGDECRNASAVAAVSLTTAENAPVAAWWERLEGSDERWRVVVDGQPIDDVICSTYWEAQPPSLSLDGRHIAYPCPVQGAIFFVADGRRYGPYREVWAYAWSEDGRHVGYGASDGSPAPSWRYYVDGEVRSGTFMDVWAPRVAPSGRIAWEARTGPESGGVLGIDRRIMASFDQILWRPAWLRPDVATWVILRGHRIIQLDLPIR